MPSTAAMDEEYVVYSAVIESMYFTDDVERFVLIAQTESGAGSGGSDEELALFLQENFEPSISDETLADHMQKHDQSVQLERHFDLPIDYVLIDESEVRDKVDERGDWQLFFEAFPGSSGVITLSPIGFNQSREQALVYTGFRGDLGSGQGYFVLLNKQDGTWTIAQTVVAWIS